MRGNHTILLRDLGQLARFAAIFSEVVMPGDFVALTGGLGAGKTTFTRFFCQALGIQQVIASPTFTLLNEYPAKHLTILHGDLYRLTDREIEASLRELEERFETPNVVTLMEWAGKAPQLAYRWTWHLEFADVHDSETARTVTLETTDSNRLSQLLEAFAHDA